MKTLVVSAAFCAVLATSAAAQFTGPSTTGREATVQQAVRARPGTYVTLTGHIVENLRGEYYTFRDKSGRLRVEIPANLWQGRPVSPDTTVRLLGEMDLSATGPYLYVKTLDIVN